MTQHIHPAIRNNDQKRLFRAEIILNAIRRVIADMTAKNPTDNNLPEHWRHEEAAEAEVERLSGGAL